MRHSATVSVGHSRQRLKVACQGGGQHVNGKSEELPSSIFLISTERSATSLSTTNCSLSEVTRRTIVGVDERCSVYREVADRIIRRSEQTLFHPLTGQCHHAPIIIMSFLPFLRLLDSAYSPFSVLGQPLSNSFFILSHPWQDPSAPLQNVPEALCAIMVAHQANASVLKSSQVRCPFVSLGDVFSLSR